jgi:hypothetical protein
MSAAASPIAREELLRAATAMPMSAWRGRSGRRYVVGIRAAATVDAQDLLEAVVILVVRGRNGIAENLGVSAVTDMASARAFVGGRPKTCTELHVHRLAANAAERAAIVADLQREA